MPLKARTTATWPIAASIVAGARCRRSRGRRDRPPLGARAGALRTRPSATGALAASARPCRDRIGAKCQHAQQGHLEAKPRLRRHAANRAGRPRRSDNRAARPRAACAAPSRAKARRIELLVLVAPPRERSARSQCAAATPPDRRARDRNRAHRGRARVTCASSPGPSSRDNASTIRVTWPRSMVPSIARAFASFNAPPPKAIS